MTVKMDRKYACGIAQLVRMGWFRPVHVKSMASQEMRALLVARKQLLNKVLDIETSMRGILRGFGLKVGNVVRQGFEPRIRELVRGQATLERIIEAMLTARATLRAEFNKLHKAGLAIVRDDAVCRRLMTVPGVGPLAAITFKSAVDDPRRIRRSKAAGALFGLTPRKYQSGERDVTGAITRVGDEMVRTALYEVANALLLRVQRFSRLKRWGMEVPRARHETREGGAGAQDRRDHASHVARRHVIPLGRGRSAGLSEEEQSDARGPNRRPCSPKSRRRDDGADEAASWLGTWPNDSAK